MERRRRPGNSNPTKANNSLADLVGIEENEYPVMILMMTSEPNDIHGNNLSKKKL
jgi:hypothetical protein